MAPYLKCCLAQRAKYPAENLLSQNLNHSCTNPLVVYKSSSVKASQNPLQQFRNSHVEILGKLAKRGRRQVNQSPLNLAHVNAVNVT